MVHEIQMYACTNAQGHVRLGLVLGRHPKINLFVLHYCVICCQVEAKLKCKWFAFCLKFPVFAYHFMYLESYVL